MHQILVVDDNMSTLKQIGAMLSGQYDFSLMRSGADALTYCECEKPDLILLDVRMPEMDGFETLAKLRLIAGMEAVPVIFLTGDLDSETEAKAIKAGGADYITKPVDWGALSRSMALHLQLDA